MLGLDTIIWLFERLTIDRALKWISGFARWKRLSAESTVSRAFADFAVSGLAERTHAALAKAIAAFPIASNTEIQGCVALKKLNTYFILYPNQTSSHIDNWQIQVQVRYWDNTAR